MEVIRNNLTAMPYKEWASKLATSFELASINTTNTFLKNWYLEQAIELWNSLLRRNMPDKDVNEVRRLASQNHTIYGTSRSESLANLVDDLADEVERHRAIMEMRVDKETLLKYFHAEAGKMDIAVEPPEFIRKLLAVLLLTAMDDTPNFQTAGITWKAEDYELTIRKLDGKSPAQLIGELKAENESLRKRFSTRCIHCDPAFVPQVEDDYCACKCHIKELGF